MPSGEDERVVGFEDPAVHQVFWFKLRKDNLTYVPKIDKYFKLQKVRACVDMWVWGGG